MKLLTTAILSSAIALSSMAAAACTNNPTVASKTVSYVCQQGKKVKATYGFNKQGLTTYASAVINGKRVQMPVNLDKPDNVETFYGKEGGYVLGTDVMDGKSYRKQPTYDYRNLTTKSSSKTVPTLIRQQKTAFSEMKTLFF